jgi:hypothetical protein
MSAAEQIAKVKAKLLEAESLFKIVTIENDPRNSWSYNPRIPNITIQNTQTERTIREYYEKITSQHPFFICGPDRRFPDLYCVVNDRLVSWDIILHIKQGKNGKIISTSGATITNLDKNSDFEIWFDRDMNMLVPTDSSHLKGWARRLELSVVKGKAVFVLPYEVIL